MNDKAGNAGNTWRLGANPSGGVGTFGLRYNTATPEYFTANSAGNVGISSGTPQYRLVVSSGAGEAGNMLVISTGSSNVIRLTGAGEIYANRYYGEGGGLTGVIHSTEAIQASLGAVILSTQALSLATGTNAINTLVKRDGSGNFSAGAITADSIKAGVHYTPKALEIDYNSDNNNSTAYGIYLRNNNTAGSPGTTYGVYSELGGAVGDPAYGIYSIITNPGANRFAAVFEGGNVGISTGAPQATLDINGYMRLGRNASQPAACGVTNDGAIALTTTTAWKLCICDGGATAWKFISDGTACSW